MPHRNTLPALLLLAASCVLPKYDPSGTRCDDAHPCPGGLACVVGFCGAACESPPAACSGAERPCLTTLAGSGGPALADGTGSAARFRGPTHLLALADGTVVVADTGNHALRRVTASGEVTTIAGDGTCDALDPRSLCAPYGLAAGDRGELYVTALESDSVMRVENGQVSRVIGTGLPGEYVRPMGVAYASGRLAVTRSNHCEVRFHELDGGRARDGTGALVPPVGGSCGVMLDGYQLGWLDFVAVSPDGSTLYFGDASTLWSVPLQQGLPSGPARFVAGWDEGFRDGVADVARFDNVSQVLPTASGVWVADRRNHRLRRIEGGSVSTVAGGASPGIDDGPVASALLAEPAGVAELNGALWFTSPLDHRVRKLENGVVSTVAGEPAAPLEDGCAAKVRLAAPSGAAVDPRDGTVYFSDTLHHAVRALGTNGTVVTLVSGPPGARSGPFAQARLNAPRGVEVLADGGVVVADTGNGRLVHLDVVSRRLDTLVGAERGSGFQLPGCQPHAETTPAVAELCAPKSVARGPLGEVYFTDSAEPGQGKLVRLSADRSRVDELLNAWWFPRGLTVAPSGDIVVADVNTDEVNVYSPMGQPLATLVHNDDCGHGQHWARRCTPADVSYLGDELVVLFEGASTVAKRPAAGTAFVRLAGAAFERGSGDGPAGNRLDGPTELTATDGGWVIADTLNHRLRLLLP